MRQNIFSLHERIDQEECKHNNFFPHLISVCKFQRFPSVHQMPAISILDAMPSTIAVLATIDEGLDAMPSLITVINNGIYLQCKWVSVHSGQRLCTGDLGSKSHDCFFHVFHSLTSKEPFPCPAAWKIFFLFDAWSPHMHSNNELVVFPEHLVMGPKLHSDSNSSFLLGRAFQQLSNSHYCIVSITCSCVSPSCHFSMSVGSSGQKFLTPLEVM